MNEVIDYMINKYKTIIKEAIMQESIEKIRQANGIRKELTGMELALICIEEDLITASGELTNENEVLEFAHGLRMIKNKIHKDLESIYE